MVCRVAVSTRPGVCFFCSPGPRFGVGRLVVVHFIMLPVGLSFPSVPLVVTGFARWFQRGPEVPFPLY